MKNLKLILILSLFVGLAACQKDTPEMDAATVEIEFGISHLLPDGTKDLPADPTQVPTCADDLTAVKAEIDILQPDGSTKTYHPEVFYVGDKLYTQTIKLELGKDVDKGTFVITKFLVKNGEDPEKIIMAVPETGSDYAEYISPDKTIGYSFEINAFEKKEIAVEVLCFVREEYENFGFTWFEIGQIEVRSLCFFGDICADGMGTFQAETAYAGDFEGPGPPPGWWYYYGDVAFYYDVNYTGGEPIVQTIYAGQKPTDGTATYTVNETPDGNATLTIDLADWSLQPGNETVKVGWFHYNDDGEVEWTEPGQLELKGTDLEVQVPVADENGIAYDYLIIHLDVQRGDPQSWGPVPGNFEGSLYANQQNGVQYEMPAIFEVKVFKDGNEVPGSPFSNAGWYGEGQPLCVEYPNNLGVDGEQFEFELYVLVPDGNGDFQYQLYQTLSATDGGPIHDEQGNPINITHGVLDFVIGNCLYYPSDLDLQWMDP